MAYKSKYTGKQVDDLLTKIEEGDLDITIDQELSLESPNAIANSAVTKAIDNLPIKKGYYPNMSVGKADNLVGRGDVQDALINFRPSAGADNITDGAARIKKIKGNSAVYNQVMPTTNATLSTSPISSIRDNGIVTCNGTTSPTGSGAIGLGLFVANDVGHKYLFICNIISNEGDSVEGKLFILANRNTIGSSRYIKNGVASIVYENTQAESSRNRGVVIVGGNNLVVTNLKVRVRQIDLTKMFGTEVANNITSYEDYLQLKPISIEDEFAYNEGELIDMKVDSLISTSDNAYDYTKGYARVMGEHTYDCSYGTAFVEKVYFSTDKDNIVAEENAMTSENGKYVFPSDGYAVPYTTDGNVREYCVCLQHSYTKPHPPYQQEVKDLSFISEVFPKGMRSAGSAYDEIRFNPTTKKWEAVKRIGELVLSTIPTNKWTKVQFNGYDAFSAPYLDLGILTDESGGGNVIMNTYVKSGLGIYKDGQDKAFEVNHQYYGNSSARDFVVVRDTQYTDVTSFVASLANNDTCMLYELAEPIVEEIEGSENWNLDYSVWDFGSEEAIASTPSAPFRADINYEPNAVDDLRWAVSEIRSLMAQLAQLQSTQTSETNLTE